MTKRFEYALKPTIKGAVSIEEIEVYLNDKGREGWELCGIDYGCFILKREVFN